MPILVEVKNLADEFKKQLLEKYRKMSDDELYAETVAMTLQQDVMEQVVNERESDLLKRLIN